MSAATCPYCEIGMCLLHGTFTNLYQQYATPLEAATKSAMANRREYNHTPVTCGFCATRYAPTTLSCPVCISWFEDVEALNNIDRTREIMLCVMQSLGTLPPIRRNP